MTARAAGLLALIGVLAAGCTGGAPDDSSIVRGRRLAVVALPPASEASMLDAAIRAAFDVDPSLTLMVHPRRLPRTAGYDGGEEMPAGVVSELRRAGMVRGSCEPRHDAARDTPRCVGTQAGYVVRVSDVFQGAGDTLQLNFAAEKFAAATGRKPEALRFEKIFQLRHEGAGWRVVREARVHEPG